MSNRGVPHVRVDADPTPYDVSTPPLYSDMVGRVQTVLREIIESRGG